MSYSKAELYGNAKFTDPTIRVIRRRGAAGEHPRALAREYLCAPDTIRKILRWETYSLVAEVGVEEEVERKYVPAPGEVEASLARLQAKLEEGASPAPTLEEALKAQALKEEVLSPRHGLLDF